MGSFIKWAIMALSRWLFGHPAIIAAYAAAKTMQHIVTCSIPPDPV